MLLHKHEQESNSVTAAAKWVEGAEWSEHRNLLLQVHVFLLELFVFWYTPCDNNKDKDTRCLICLIWGPQKKWLMKNDDTDTLMVYDTQILNLQPLYLLWHDITQVWIYDSCEILLLCFESSYLMLIDLPSDF